MHPGMTYLGLLTPGPSQAAVGVPAGLVIIQGSVRGGNTSNMMHVAVVKLPF